MPARVTVEGDTLVVTAGIGLFIALRKIPGGQWHPTRQSWLFPATGTTSKALEKLPGLDWTPDARASIEPDERQQTAVPAQAPAAITAPCEPSHFPVPAGVRTRPWAHQHAAFAFAMRLLCVTGGCLLAMAMGVGKSLVAIMIIAQLYAEDLLVLIACPLRVCPVWAKQLKEHLDRQLVIGILDADAGTIAQRTAYAQECIELGAIKKLPVILIVNYEAFVNAEFEKWVSSHKWGLVIADESHKIKSPAGTVSHAFKRLAKSATRRLLLTGTPMAHSLLDVYAQFRFLDINIFGKSFAAFRQHFAILGGYHGKQVLGFQRKDELEHRMAPVTFRVNKDVLDLPSEMHQEYYCEMSDEARRVYDSLEELLVADVENGVVTAANALVRLLRLQQITGGSIKTDDGKYHRIDRSKATLLQDLLEDIDASEAVVVFAHFRADLDVIEEVCEKLGRTYMELSGRKSDLDAWQAGQGSVLGVQIKAGGVGIDLTRARYGVYYSMTLSLGEYDQSLARIHRPGQTQPVLYLHLITRKSVDERIRRALEKRAHVIESILKELTYVASA